MDEPLTSEWRDALATAEQRVETARIAADKAELAEALKALAHIQRRFPQLHSEANKSYREMAGICLELDQPLEAAWAIRHIGINLEHDEQIEDAERCYDESLELFREHATDNSLNYANTVRYPAVIKNRLGKIEEARKLWQETYERYLQANLPEGGIEAAAALTQIALDEGDMATANAWWSKCEAAAAKSNDPDSQKTLRELRGRFQQD